MTLPRQFLLPGEYVVTSRPREISTVLGSCVAVCLKHKDKKVSAMNHAMHPNFKGLAINKRDIGLYADTSVENLLSIIFDIDANPNNYSAELFGGANSVGIGMSDNGDNSIGSRNILETKKVLNKNNVFIANEFTGGSHGVRLIFDTSSGVVKREMIDNTRDKTYKKKSKVLIVDDSSLVRSILDRALQNDESFEVCGKASDAYEARDLLVRLNPDVITLDIIMPKMDGLSFLRKIMLYYPKPVVVISTIATEKSKIKQDALTAGAAKVLNKNKLEIYKGLDVVKHEVREALRAAMLLKGKVV